MNSFVTWVLIGIWVCQVMLDCLIIIIIILTCFILFVVVCYVLCVFERCPPYKGALPEILVPPLKGRPHVMQ